MHTAIILNGDAYLTAGAAAVRCAGAGPRRKHQQRGDNEATARAHTGVRDRGLVPGIKGVDAVMGKSPIDDKAPKARAGFTGQGLGRRTRARE